MKFLAAFVMFAASVAFAQLQGVVSYNSTTGVFTCPAYTPNGAFCADSSLLNSIIIRCNNGIGQPGNCNDNLSGEFPGGLSYAPCWETSPTSGDAACSKNCVVYGSSGSANGTFTLPNCIPTATPSSSIASSFASQTSIYSTSLLLSTTAPSSSSILSLSTLSSSVSISSILSTSSTSVSSSSSTSLITATSTVVSTTLSSMHTSTIYSPSTLFSVISSTGSSLASSSAALGTGIGSGSTGSPAPLSNSTLSTGVIGSASFSPTATPVGPTKPAMETPPSFTGGAIINHAGSALAVVGLVIAYFL